MILQHGNKNFLLDLKSNQITFLDSRFYLTDTGEFVPSVTTYLEAYPKSPQFFEWLKANGKDADDIRDEAGRRGSTVHSLTEQFDNGLQVDMLDENGYVGYKLSEWAMLMKYAEFRSNHDTEVIHNELNLVSATHQMGGTLDRVMKINQKRYIVDIKTANSIHPHYWLQLEAYNKMYEEKFGDKVDGVAILWLNAKTRTEGKKDQIQGRGWQLVICEDQKEREKNWKLFKACQTLWMAENGDQRPRELSYKLSVKYNVGSSK